MRLAVSGLTALTGDLEGPESIEERVFRTVRAALDAAGLEPRDCDAVVLAADDVADGRSITTMLHATAAGAYLLDEIRITNGSLTALGLASLRILAGLAERVIVAAWWLPSAGWEALARSGLDVGYGRRLVAPERLAPEAREGASAACVLSRDGTGPALEGFAFAQVDYERWLACDGEPEGVLGRLGRDLARRSRALEGEGLFATSGNGEWTPLREAAGVPASWRATGPATNYGLAEGLVLLAGAAAGLAPGEQAVVAATGVPPFLQVEAARLSGAAGA